MRKNFTYILHNLVPILTLAMLFVLQASVDTSRVYAANETSLDTAWSSTFGGNRHDEAFSVISIDKADEADNVIEGYVFTGTFSDDTGLQYAALVKNDKAGNSLWVKKFGMGSYRNAAHSVIFTSDKGFALTGTRKDFTGSIDNIHVIKTDGDGNLQWKKMIDLGEVGFSCKKKQGFSIKEVEDGYIIAGVVFIEDASDALLVKIDSQGTLQWAKSFGRPQSEWLYDVETVSDGILAAGSIEISGKYHEYIVKVAYDGSHVWEHIGDYEDSQFKDLVVSEDGSLAATGCRQSNISLVKLTDYGAVTFISTYGAGIGYGLVELGNGSIRIAGNSKLVGVKPDGKKAWEKVIDTADSAAESVAMSATGSVVYAGYKSFSGNSDALLFEISEDKASLLGKQIDKLVK